MKDLRRVFPLLVGAAAAMFVMLYWSGCSVDRITEVKVEGDSISVILPSRVDTVFVTDTVFVFCNDPQLVECE